MSENKCATKVQTTLDEIFGVGTFEYDRFVFRSLFGGPLIMGGMHETRGQAQVRDDLSRYAARAWYPEKFGERNADAFRSPFVSA